MKLYVTARDGEKHGFEVSAGMTAMEAIRDGLDEEPFAVCGGMCSCATCHVFVSDEDIDRLPPISEEEDDMLDGSENRRHNSRLSCQIELGALLDGLRLTVAPE